MLKTKFYQAKKTSYLKGNLCPINLKKEKC